MWSPSSAVNAKSHLRHKRSWRQLYRLQKSYAQFSTLMNRTYHRSENFCCKNIFVVCINHKNKNHKIYFITIIMVSTFCTHGFTMQLAIVVFCKQLLVLAQLASYFTRDGLRVWYPHRWLMTNAWQPSLYSIQPQYTTFLGTLLHSSSLPAAAW